MKTKPKVKTCIASCNKPARWPKGLERMFCTQKCAANYARYSQNGDMAWCRHCGAWFDTNEERGIFDHDTHQGLCASCAEVAN